MADDDRIQNSGAVDYKIDSATDYVLVAKGADELEGGAARGLLVGVAGTANLTTLDGEDRDGVPLVAGYNMLICTKVRAGGTADNIWALY